MADVGRLAKVSTQTVSRYFTGVGYVREDTRERIAAAIEELGYRRNQSATAFRTQRTNMVGVMSMGPINFGSAEILTGLGLAARRAGMTITISQLDVSLDSADWQQEVQQSLDHLLSIPADAIVVVTPYAGVEQLLRDNVGSTPLVTVSDRPTMLASVASIHSHQAALLATRHLIGLGHRAIVHIAGPAGRNETHERIRGYSDAMTRAGFQPHVVQGAEDWSPVGGFRAAQRLQPGTDFTAVLTANDEIALGFLHGMQRRGFSAPADYSVIGIDDMPGAAYFSPPLTTMQLDFRTLGEHGFAMVQHELATGQPAGYEAIEPKLVVRNSALPINEQNQPSAGVVQDDHALGSETA